MKSRLVLAAIVTACLGAAAHAEPVKRTRYPSLSPDGKTIAFSYQGDLWTVPAEGGSATRLTTHLARDIQPIWSPDGKTIAFTSNRYGNYDLFTMPARGGSAKRITFHSAQEYPSSFSPDGRWLLYYGNAYDGLDIYRVPVEGGEPVRLTWDRMEREYFGSVSPDGRYIVYNHSGGPGSWRRRGYEGSNNADVWIARFTAPVSEPRKITGNPAQDFAPQFSRDGRRIFYVSDRKGLVNIWSMDLNGGAQKQHTFHTTDGARIPSLAPKADRLVYEYNSEIWLLDLKTNRTAPVRIDIATDERRNFEGERTLTSNPSEVVVSPDGKKLALIVRGDLFVMPATGGLARRLVGGPSRESHVAWMPNSKTVLYCTDEKGQKDLRAIDISGQNGRVIAETEEDETNAVPSPDGNWIAYHLNDHAIAVVAASGGAPTTTIKGTFPDVSRGYEPHLSWSQDNKWLVFVQTGAALEDSVWVAELANPQPRRVTRFLRHVNRPKWAPNGRMIFFTGIAVDQMNLYAVDLVEDGPPEFEEDNIEKLDRPRQNPGGNRMPAAIDWTGVEKRLRRVTGTGNVSDAVMSPSGRTFLIQVGDELQTIPADAKNGRGSQIADNARGLELPADGSRVFFLSGGQIQSLGMQARDRRTSAFRATVEVDLPAENRQVFEEAWWVMDRYFYSENHNQVDWKGIRAKYEALLPYVPYKEDFYDLMSEMVQELRGSHLGVTGPADYTADTPSATAYLGLEPDWETLARDGVYKVARVTPESPADSKWSKVSVGEYVVAVDGQEFGKGRTMDDLLNRKAGRKVVLTVNSQPTMDGARQVAIKPLSPNQGEAVEYEAWVEQRKEIVKRLSGGRLAYIHIAQMNVSSEMRFKEEFVGEATGRDGMLVDVRYNGGGNVAHRLLDILRKKPYVYFRPRSLGQNVMQDWFADYLWGKPAALLINQDSASNSEMMAEGFKALGIGPVIGIPTMGAVIATGTWSFLDGGTIRTPASGVYTASGENMELRGRQPDVLVPYDPVAVKEGRDPQLEKAVQTLMGRLPPSQAKAGEGK